MEQKLSTFDESPLSVGDFLIMFILLIIPIVNLIMMFVWAFSGNGNLNRRNFARAGLIVVLIEIILTAIFWGSISALFFRGGVY
jgi:hypothetical protein